MLQKVGCNNLGRHLQPLLMFTVILKDQVVICKVDLLIDKEQIIQEQIMETNKLTLISKE